MKKKNSNISENFYWIFALFGSAVGAGTLFLPIQANIGGIWVLITAFLLIYFMVYPPHKLFARLVNHAEHVLDYTTAVNLFLGKKGGMVISVLFILFLYSLMMANSIGLNNDIGEFLLDNKITKTDLAKGPYLSLIIIVICFSILKFGMQTLIKALGILSFILVLFLLAISFMLIKMWNFEDFFAFPSFYEFFKQLFLLLPILLMSFVFFTVVSPMIASFKKQGTTGSELEKRYSGILKSSTIITMIIVLLFIFSSILAMSVDNMQMADSKNISVLALLGTLSDNTFLKEFGPIISIIALVTSVFGIALGIYNSCIEIISGLFKDKNSRKTKTISEVIFYSFSIPFLWLTTISNMNIIILTGEIITPLISIILYFIPVYIIFKLPAFKQYRTVGNILIFMAGVLFFVSFYLGRMM